jgi:hypothetical protein
MAKSIEVTLRRIEAVVELSLDLDDDVTESVVKQAVARALGRVDLDVLDVREAEEGDG